MSITLEEQIIKTAKQAMAEAITTELCGYNKPLSVLTNEVIAKNSTELKTILDNSVKDLLSSEEFKKAMKEQLNQKLAKIIINKTGGELEKKVNEFKQDPTTRAKITLAMDTLMNDLLEGK